MFKIGSKTGVGGYKKVQNLKKLMLVKAFLMLLLTLTTENSDLGLKVLK